MPDESVTREIFGNIDPVSKWLFYVLTVVSLGCFSYGVVRRVRLWRMGKPARLPEGRIGSTSDGRRDWRRIVQDVLLQRTVRRTRPRAALAHQLLFGGFGVLFIGTVLIAIEHYAAAASGRAPNEPLFHKGLYFAVYELVLDTAGLAMLAGCAWFIRRRLQGDSSVGHQRLDSIVLATLILLGVTGYLTEGLRILREQTPQPGFSYVGLGVARVFELAGVTPHNVPPIHWGLWWSHTVLALGLIAAFPYTRLLHSIAGAISLATRSTPPGTMHPVSLEEVEETGLVGAAHIQDFTPRQLLELDACVSCGRCQDVCPAYEAGKPLSPRDVVQDLRLQLNAAGLKTAADSETDSASLHETVRDEVSWSCTTCHACVDLCPLGVDPLRFITDLRRNLVAEGRFRGTPAVALQKTQRSGNPWGLPADERLNWADGLSVPRAADHPDFEVLYWVGCAAAYDRRIQKVARAVVRLLQAAGVNFAVLGPEERCTGESARRMGDEFLFQELAATNLETLNRYSVRKIVTHCPHCLNSLKRDYPQFGGQFEVIHHTEYLAGLLKQGQLKISPSVPDSEHRWTYHDPCYLARVNNVTAAPRDLIQLTLPSAETGGFVELPRNGRNTACCGAGGGRMWFDDEADGRVGTERVNEVLRADAANVVVACPFCLTMIQDGLAAQDSRTEAKDIAELLVEALDTHD